MRFFGRDPGNEAAIQALEDARQAEVERLALAFRCSQEFWGGYTREQYQADVHGVNLSCFTAMSKLVTPHTEMPGVDREQAVGTFMEENRLTQETVRGGNHFLGWYSSDVIEAELRDFADQTAKRIQVFQR